MEGEYLEVRRQLTRTKEKNLQARGGPLGCCGGVLGRCALLLPLPCTKEKNLQARPACAAAAVGCPGACCYRSRHRLLRLGAAQQPAARRTPCRRRRPPTTHHPHTLPQLARKLADVRDAAERGDPLPFTPRGGAAAAVPAAPGAHSAVSPLREGIGAVAAGSDAPPAPPASERKRSLLGGLL